MPLKKELINLSMFISSLQEQFKEALDAKKIEIEILVEDDLEVLADRYMLESIVKNLINNAVKFTPEEGKIEIDAVAGKNNVLLSIRDTGIGIPEESLKDVFSVGANIHSSGTNNEKGSGFGLILCKELIRRNGGNIFVKSKPGEGSVFSITLPHS
ncbi:MAG: HAMP domain-containing sensor histidine kinase [Bacteroidota bacterium]|nr:HAMP domain-containing sensor histidine kinase [Bacteroidota bacterium]